jgi:hypothetical protein
MCFLSGMFLCLCLMWRILSLQVLYVGDHIYGDILRSKKSSVCCVSSVRGHFENSFSFYGKGRGKSQLICGAGAL